MAPKLSDFDDPERDEFQDNLKEAYEAGAAAERERCANLIESMRPSSRDVSPLFWDVYDGAAQAIRNLE